MDTTGLWIVVILAGVATVVLWRRSWNSRLRDIEPFILLFGALPATFIFVIGLSMVLRAPADSRPPAAAAAHAKR